VTALGNLWGWGQFFLDAVDQKTKEPIQVKLPSGKTCKRVWASNHPDGPCAFVELEDTKTGVKHIYSAGKSSLGLLGQGDKVKESKEFKKIYYQSESVQYVDLSVGTNAAMAVDADGKIWGWGMNVDHCLGLTDIVDSGILKPFEIFPLNDLNMKAKRV